MCSMDYETLLTEAYQNVKPVNECGRFEILHVSGHHEGTRTVITNFTRVASCIRRSPNHLMKFLCKELASSCGLSGDRLVLSRRLSSKDVNAKIEKYVNKFVLCPKCKKADTDLILEDGKTYIRCLACGSKNEVHKV